MPRKPNYLVIYIASHYDPNLYHSININYYTSLEKTLEILSYHSQRPNQLQKIPEILYNQYGQSVPLNYHVPRTGLVFYIDCPPIPPTEWKDITIVPPAIKSLTKNKESVVNPQDECWLSDSE